MINWLFVHLRFPPTNFSGRRRRNGSKRAGSARGGGIFGRIEGVAAPAVCPFSGDRRCGCSSGRRRGRQQGAPRSRVLCDRTARLLWKASPGIWAASARPTRNLGNRGGDFGLRCIKTRLRVYKADDILRAQALHGRQSLDVCFLGVVFLGHFTLPIYRHSGTTLGSIAVGRTVQIRHAGRANPADKPSWPESRTVPKRFPTSVRAVRARCCFGLLEMREGGWRQPPTFHLQYIFVRRRGRAPS